MKFWQKAFFCIMIVFLLGFDIMAYVLAERSFAINRDYTLVAAQAEQLTIQKSLTESISLSQNVFTALNEFNLSVTIAPYADYYRNQGVYFLLYQGGALIFNNLPVSDSSNNLNELRLSNNITIQNIQENPFCFISSSLSFTETDLTFIYAKDMQFLTDFKDNIIRVFINIGTVAGIITAFIVLLLLIGLTRPFRILDAAASEISQGHYDKRVNFKSNDEIGSFAGSFNAMAEHIEKHIAELRRMTESRQTFINNLTHEIRTPITAISGYGELLKYANCSNADKEVAVDHIISQSRRLLNMSLKLMDLVYMENAHIELQPLLLSDIFTEVIDSLNTKIQEKHIHLKVQLAAPSITGDAELIISLFTNLLDNAIKATKGGGSIDISSACCENGIWVIITDDGKGIVQEEIEKIKEPFYRVDKSRSRAEGGAGLGLALCLQICERHQATMEIASEMEVGTTVKVLFTAL